jgi:hypothetical protein
MSNLCQAAPLRQCELPLKTKVPKYGNAVIPLVNSLATQRIQAFYAASKLTADPDQGRIFIRPDGATQFQNTSAAD